MKRLFALIVFALAVAPAASYAQDGHEYSPLVEKTVTYKNWTLNDLKDNKPVDLRSLAQGKKLVMVVYFAPWCPSSRDDARNYFGPAGPPYTVVAESESREDRDKTPHFGYRQATGDIRKWGSPWNIFLEPAELAKTGDVLTEKAWVVNGELIEADVDKFVADHLKPSTASVIIPCKE